MPTFLVMPGIPIGASIAIALMCILLYSLIRSFVQHKVSKVMQITTLLLCISFISNAVCIILGQVVIPRHLCTLRIPVSLGSFLLTRLIFFYFLIIRIEVSFDGSSLQLSPCVLRSLKVVTISFYSLFFVATIAFAPHQVYQNDICFISDDLFGAYAALQGGYALTDLGLGVFCVGIYLHRLYGLYNEMKIGGAMDTDENRNSNTKLLRVIKKQAKLAWVAYLSTMILVMVLPPFGVTYFSYVDCAVNVLCVYCSFDSNQKWYQYLFNCNGNMCLQYVFCYLGCCCCNEKRKYKTSVGPPPKQLDNLSVMTSVTQTGSKESSGNQIDSNTSDNATVGL
eukprot:53346_1